MFIEQLHVSVYRRPFSGLTDCYVLLLKLCKHNGVKAIELDIRRYRHTLRI